MKIGHKRIGFSDSGEDSPEEFFIMDAAYGKDLSSGILEGGSAVEEFLVIKDEEAVVE